MTIGEWIDEKGATFVAYHLGITESAVHSWRSGTRKPRPEHAKRLLCLANGELAWEDIYGPVAQCDEG
jgi:hypothetical protein